MQYHQMFPKYLYKLIAFVKLSTVTRSRLLWIFIEMLWSEKWRIHPSKKTLLRSSNLWPLPILGRATSTRASNSMYSYGPAFSKTIIDFAIPLPTLPFSQIHKSSKWDTFGSSGSSKKIEKSKYVEIRSREMLRKLRRRYCTGSGNGQKNVFG